ncbi:MAG: serine/threonine-protein kinase [Xanthomonadales bacterium]|jgi:serine/threonine-protein kinase|nr:serine/threonine-protein kinase [Xanthomonadales bacterium]
MNLQIGSQIEHYTIDGLIAKGGMGVIWHAWDAAKAEAVAVKAVSNDLIADPEFKMRIQDEARRHQGLRHPNIVPVLDVFDAHGATCIVMKLVEGTSLDRLMESREKHRVPLQEAVSIISDILKALDYAHRHGIVHRDVKPANVLLDQERHALLIDFGIALAAGEERRTRTGQILGTPLYMSPEQIVQPRRIDHRSDVYSVGCVFYEMLTGRPPFVRGQDEVGNTDFAVQHAHVKLPPLHPAGFVPEIPAAVDRLVMAALAKDPADRIPGCGEFMRLLEQATKTPPPPPLKLVILLLLLLVIALGYLVLY